MTFILWDQRNISATLSSLYTDAYNLTIHEEALWLGLILIPLPKRGYVIRTPILEDMVLVWCFNTQTPAKMVCPKSVLILSCTEQNPLRAS